MVPVDDGATPAPIDRAVLERIRSRFAGSRLSEAAEIVEEGNLHLRVDLSSNYYASEGSARFEIRWYRNDDFTIHYRVEGRQTGSWYLVDDAEQFRDQADVDALQAEASALADELGDEVADVPA